MQVYGAKQWAIAYVKRLLFSGNNEGGEDPSNHGRYLLIFPYDKIIMTVKFSRFQEDLLVNMTQDQRRIIKSSAFFIVEEARVALKYKFGKNLSNWIA